MKCRDLVKQYTTALVLVLVTCLLGADYCITARAADWPNYRGPNHDGVSDETGWSTTWPAGGQRVVWKASLGTGFASIAVSNSRAYAMGNINDRDILYCFDADSGKEIWRQSYPCPLYKKNHEGGPAATPTVSGDSVYTFSKDGDVVRFKAATGEVVWHKNVNKESGIEHPTWYFAGSPLVVDNLVVLNAGTRGVALNKADGSLVWENGEGACGYASPVPFTVGGQKCVALFASRDLAAVNAATGRSMWEFGWRTSYDINGSDPIISGDTVFISSGYGRGCALLRFGASNMAEVWQNKNMRNHCSSCVLWKGHIYGFDGQYGGGGKLTCLNHQTGEKKWSQGGMGTGSLMVAGGKLVILGEKGKLVIAEASPDGFKELASAQILTGKCWTVPVLANGKIYARNADGQLVCIDVSG